MKNNQVLDTIQKTREYLDYIEEHYNNVQIAWRLLQDNCKDMNFIYDDFIWDYISQMVKDHDLSKLSHDEFISYREKFKPVKDEKITGDFIHACKHHQNTNNHHWQNWTMYDGGSPQSQPADCVLMVIDWIAMSLEFEDTARSYYNINKKNINIPEWAIKFINEIFDNIYGKEE